MEAALADVDAVLPASSPSARELEENAWFEPQTEWRQQISAEAAGVFSAALDAQRSIKEVALAHVLFISTLQLAALHMLATTTAIITIVSGIFN